jgi:hypothetical protein
MDEPGSKIIHVVGAADASSTRYPRVRSSRIILNLDFRFGCGTFTRAISTDILDFRARVLVIQGRGPANGQRLRSQTKACPSTRATCGPRFSRHRLQTRGPVASPWSELRSALHGHAAASTDGHVSHDADRFASTRLRRAAAARDVRSAGTASPVPKYISSGVCPRNAECGSTRLCSST